MDLDGSVGIWEGNFVLVTVYIKTGVAASTLGASASLSVAGSVRCYIGDETFRKYIPRENNAQIVPQLCVLRFGLTLYTADAETGILYKIIVRCPDNVVKR